MRRLLTVAALAALLLGGCGIPDDTKVTVVGAGPSGGVGAREDSIQSPNGRETAGEATQLLEYFLQAPAGDAEHALNRVKAFMTPEAAATFEAAAPEIRVIRLKSAPLYHPSTSEYTFNAQTVGTLKSDGSLEPTPPDPSGTIGYSVRISQVAGQSGYFVTSPPSKRVLLLSDTALDQFYQRRTIYFWNTDYTALIPDLRYMPSSVPSAQQPGTLLSWLITGPAGWLGDVARGLPNGTTAPENIPAVTNDTLTVTLSSQAAPPGDLKALDRLRRQLQWSLQPDLGSHTLELKIKGQDPVRYPERDYLASNPADRLVDTPQRFAVLNGVIRRITKSPLADDPVPALRPEDNKSVAAAAMSASSTHTFVAVVTSGKTGKLRVGSAENGKQAALRDVGGLAGTLGRPAWAVTADGDPQGAVGLITVNGKLYSFAPDGSAASQVEWPGEPGAITAVSVAPDGYRVAIVAGGRLYRATLDTSGDTVALGTPERLFPPIFSQVSAVAWSSETYLAVAGVREDSDGQRYAVVDVSVDGALGYTRISDAGGEAIPYLTAYPANPTSHRDNADTESYETAGAAWYVSSAPVKVPTSDLVGAPPNTPSSQTPTAPFYLF